MTNKEYLEAILADNTKGIATKNIDKFNDRTITNYSFNDGTIIRDTAFNYSLYTKLPELEQLEPKTSRWIEIIFPESRREVIHKEHFFEELEKVKAREERMRAKGVSF